MAITRIGTYAQIKGLAYSLPCKVATTGAITLSGTQTIDTIALSAGDRVLVKNQPTPADNGIYIVNAGAWPRAIDMSLNDDVFEGVQIYINQGATNGGKVFYLDTANPITINTTALTFTETTAGTSGTSGTSGSSGTSGTRGTSGTSGTSGTRGTSGTSGTSATSGTSGINGTSGTSGVNGTSGTSGTSGINGTSGTSGINGTSGTSGVNGTSGTSGTSGTRGTSGTSGVNGTSGTSGVNGTSGTSGTSGTRGTSGTSGVNGTSGTSGSSGTSPASQISGTLTAGYVPKATGTNVIANSLIYDNGTNVGIGTNNPLGNVHISGGTGSAVLILHADVNNTVEDSNPKIWFKQDGDFNEGAIQLNASNELNIISNVDGGGGIVFRTGQTDNTGSTDPINGAILRMKIFPTGNIVVDSATDQGYKFAVVGTVGITSTLTVDSVAKTLSQLVSEGAAKGNSGTGTVTFDWDGGNVQTVTLTGSCTFAFSNPRGKNTYQIIITQDATGSRTITWPTIKWEGGSAPSLTGTANSIDIVTLTYDGTSYYGVIAKNFA